MSRLGRAQPFKPLILKQRIVAAAGAPVGRMYLTLADSSRLGRAPHLLVQKQRIVGAAAVSTRRRMVQIT